MKVLDELTYSLAIETTKILMNKQEKLQKIKWNSGEANLDSEYSQLACNCCYEAWNIIKTLNPELNTLIMICVIPDITITFTWLDGSQVNKKIELKSSKNVKMPGSTIKKLDINQPLIFCLRPKNKTIGTQLKPTNIQNNDNLYRIKCSQYHTAMSENNNDLFQDR